MTHLKHRVIFLFTLVSMFFSAQNIADESHATARKLRMTGEILPLETIYQKAQKIKSGKILEAELEKKQHRYLYEIELLDNNGQVWEIKLDAKTGQLIELEED